MIQRIKKEVTHQGIGGKEFIVDEQITTTLNPSEIWEQCNKGNYACLNFITRRKDFDPVDDKDLNFPYKLYYVKVEGIGYIIAEDEIETIMKPGDKFETTLEAGKSGGLELSSDFKINEKVETEENTYASIKVPIADFNIDGEISIEKIIEKINESIDDPNSNDKPDDGVACASAMVAPVIEDTIKPVSIGIDLGQVINGKDLVNNINKSFISGGRN